MMNRSDKVLLGVMARSPSPELDVAALCTTGDGRTAEIGPRRVVRSWFDAGFRLRDHPLDRRSPAGTPRRAVPASSKAWLFWDWAMSKQGGCAWFRLS
jgi:hypothetical protein